MQTKSPGDSRSAGKIALLVGAIVIALAVLVYSYGRYTSGGSYESGPVRQMMPGARVAHPPGGGTQ